MCLLFQEAVNPKKYNVAISQTKREGLSRIKREKPDLGFFEKWEKCKLRKVKRKRLRKEITHHKKEISNVLIIDNEKDMCSLLQDALNHRKYNVAIANTKREALSCIKREMPDVVFLDLKLPDGDGIKLISKIKKTYPETVVNIISAYGSEEKREEAKKMGAYSFIDKPFTEIEILKSIRELNR